MEVNVIYNLECLTGLKTLPDNSVDCCVTSPPYYGLRDYGHDGQIGLEETPEAYVAKMVEVFREVRRVLKPEGTLWLNLGDSYAGSGMGAANYPELSSAKQRTNHGASTVKGRGGMTYGLKPKDLIGIPWMVAFALRSDGWYLRQDLIWAKPNPMPESVTDRCTKSHEYIFLMSKSARYYYDADAIKQPIADASVVRLSQDVASQEGSDRVPGKTNGKMKAVGSLPHKNLNYNGQQNHSFHKKRADGDEWQNEDGKANKRSVWTVTTKPFKEAHFATYPEDLIVDCIKAGCPERIFTCSCCGLDVYLNYETKSNRENLQRMQELIHSRIQVSQTKILQPEVFGVECKNDSKTIMQGEVQKLPTMQQEIPVNRQMEQGEDILREGMFVESNYNEPGFNEGMDNNIERVQNDTDAVSPQCKQSGVCNGASPCNGASNRQVFNKTGGSPSHKSQQTGQQNNKSGDFNKEGTRQIAEAPHPIDLLSSLWEENKNIGTCPKCGGDVICRKGLVLDVFMGAGTTGLVARKLNRNYIGFELNPEYKDIAEKRIRNEIGLFA